MISPLSGDYSFELNDYIDSLIKGDRKKCQALISKYLETNPNTTKIYEEVIKKSMYRVGEMWESNQISVATEHLATSITESLLNHIFQSVDSDRRVGKKVIIAGTEKENHQVGIKMVADLFEKHGWETFFLGGNVPTKDLILFLKTTEPDLLALSLSIYNNLPNLERMIAKIREIYPTLPIIIGGRAFLTGGLDVISKFKSAFYIPDMYILDIFIKNQNEYT